jgi:hypothetical protein
MATPAAPLSYREFDKGPSSGRNDWWKSKDDDHDGHGKHGRKDDDHDWKSKDDDHDGHGHGKHSRKDDDHDWKPKDKDDDHDGHGHGKHGR